MVKLFVGGLSFSTSSDRLREVFAAHGTVESASVVTDPETGRSRGFGFVQMGSEEEAQLAVSRLNGKEVDGRSIRVEVAKPSERGGGPGRRDDRPPRGGGGGRGGRTSPRW
jgi:RNA recognition motif-containing protein